jgi:hypothetical protein
MTTRHGFGGVLGTTFGRFPFGLSQCRGHGSWLVCEEVALRATLHTRLSARDHYTSSTLIGGKGGAG